MQNILGDVWGGGDRASFLSLWERIDFTVEVWLN